MNFENIKPKPAVVRQSCVSCAYACKRKWFYQYRLGVVLRGGELKEAAELGTIYHKLQQAGPGHEQEVKDWVLTKQKRLMERADKGEDIDGNMVRLANLMTSLYHKAEVMARLFWKKYPQPDYLVPIGTEIKMSIDFDGLILEGTIDKLLRNNLDNKYWIRDHKSTGRSLESIFGGLAWSIQARIYRILAVKYLTSKSTNIGLQPRFLEGFIFDGILKPGIKLCRTDDKNAKTWNCSVEEAYLRRVEEWYTNTEIEKDKKTILSKAIIYNEPIYPDELKEVFSMMRDLFGRPIHPEQYPRDVTRQACWLYNKQCIYHDLCDSPLWRWDELFQNKYKFSEEKNNEEETEEA